MDIPKGRIWANLLVDSTGAASNEGRSAPLRTVEDGRRFHQIRKAAKSIVIGGNTYRNEPYSKSPAPLFVASRKLSESTSEKLKIINAAPHEVVAAALNEYGAPVLVEAGPDFLSELLARKVIDYFFLSKVKASGDSNFLDMKTLQSNYKLVSSESEGETIFETWVPKH